MTKDRRTALITGSSGLIGSEAVAYFDQRGWRVEGVDNNMRRRFFGPDGDTTWNLERLRQQSRRFSHHDLEGVVHKLAGAGVHEAFVAIDSPRSFQEATLLQTLATKAA